MLLFMSEEQAASTLPELRFSEELTLQLLSNLVGHDVKKAPVFFRETPWFGVEQAGRPDREFVHP